MKIARSARILFCLLLGISPIPSALAQNGNSEAPEATDTPVLEALRVPFGEQIHMDGVLDEAAWSRPWCPLQMAII